MSTSPISPARQGLVDRSRAEWIRRLVDLSRRNNLLYFRPLKTGTLDLPKLAAESLASLLSDRSIPLCDLCAIGEDSRLAGVAGEIRRRALTNREERGLETLYVAFGSVTWQADDGGRNPDAPALLLPVTIQSPGRDLKRATLSRAGDLEINPVLVQAIDPRVAVTCNGPKKGGNLETQKTLKKVKSLQASFQLHRNVDLKPDEQTPAEFIANTEDTANCKGVYIKASVAPDGKSYTVQIGDKGKVHKFETRQ